jgi:hypothetical protein
MVVSGGPYLPFFRNLFILQVRVERVIAPTRELVVLSDFVLSTERAKVSFLKSV